MDFRSYTPYDLNNVVSIFRSNIPKYFSAGEEPGLIEFLENHGHEYRVGEVDGKVISCGGIALNGDETVSLCWGMVRKEYIGKGYGRELTEFRLDLAREKYGDLPVVISTSQHTSGFYEKLGFRRFKHVPDGFGPGIDICEMRQDAGRYG